jgi:HlyD family secretion protein
MKPDKNDIIYSDQVQEIISAPPRRLIRWGSAVVFIVLILIVLMAWLVRYPDVIRSDVEITTVRPPVTLVAKRTGRITQKYVSDNDTVTAGLLIAVMETAASVDEISILRSVLDTMASPGRAIGSSLPKLQNLGEVQNLYSTYLRTLSELNSYLKNDLYGAKIDLLENEIDAVREYTVRLRERERLLTESQDIGKNKFKRDSVLHKGNHISDSEMETSRQEYIRTRDELQKVRIEQAARSIDLASKLQVLADYRIRRAEESEMLITKAEEALQNLKAGFSVWENEYLLYSRIDGIISFTNYWSEDQVVEKDKPVFSIVPLNAGNLTGRLMLGMYRSGKVREGMAVNIKLRSYPYLEYGMIRGLVRAKSLVPTGDKYLIEIELPGGLTTLYGRKLDFSQNMTGEAEIITNKLSLLQKVLDPLRYLATKNSD